ncbi:MAG: hypothetical protein Q4D29_13420, partial [Lachnospiraceae bacterium]|nr:hypothetical protein [Lachnospiraceae bacterium]
AIGRFKSWGIKIAQPDINNSDVTFLPNVNTNTILYGLRGITNISVDLIKEIIKGRPYTSFEDFNNRIPTTKVQMVNLIKAGCFDSISGIPKTDLMYKYLDSVTDKKTSLSLSSMATILEYNLLPANMAALRKIYAFNKDLKTWKKGENYILPDNAVNFIGKVFTIDMLLNGNELPVKTWKSAYDDAMSPLKEYIKNNKQAMLTTINARLLDDMIKKYANGTTNKWEMESLSFYYHEHELAKLRLATAVFDNLPKKPTTTNFVNTRKGDKIPIYDLQLIAGTVIDKNKTKNTVTLLTTDGVVLVKVYKDSFSEYDKQISKIGEDGKKHVIEKSWFTKGTLLVVQGIRRDDNFILKKYKSSYYPTISKIAEIAADGTPSLIFARAEADD